MRPSPARFFCPGCVASKQIPRPNRLLSKVSRDSTMQREYAIRQIAKREGFSLEKHGEDSYRLINERLNVIVFGLDGVPLETIASFLEKPESLANSPDAHLLLPTYALMACARSPCGFSFSFSITFV